MLAKAMAAAAGAGGLVYGASYLPAFLGRGAPFVPMAPAKISALFGDAGTLRERGPWLGAAARDCTLVDLGSGDGSLVRAATRMAGFKKAVGYEVACCADP
jgi:hypothetical protein|eukprot:6328399-Prymnesium_polylepis.3